METIYRAFLVSEDYCGYEVIEEKYFNSKEKAMGYLSKLIEKGTAEIRENCNYSHLEWRKGTYNTSDAFKDTVVEYYAYYEWEKHASDCKRRFGYEYECNCEYARHYNNLTEYMFRVILTKIIVE